MSKLLLKVRMQMHISKLPSLFSLSEMRYGIEDMKETVAACIESVRSGLGKTEN